MYNPQRLRRYARKSRKSFGKYRKSFKRYSTRFAKTSRRTRRSGYRSKRSGGTLQRLGGYASTAYSALRLAKTVYSLINPEMKYLDNNTYNLALTTAVSTRTLITSIGQGTGPNQRTGNSVLGKYIKATFRMRFSGSTPAAIRLTIVSTSDGSVPDRSQIYQVSDTNDGLVVSAWKKNSDIRYKVHYDRVLYMDTYKPIQIVKKDIKIRGHHHMTYTGSAGTDTGPGNFYCFMTPDTTSAITATFLFRIGYLDN
uniref:Capsid protein n=1 Tax=Ciconia boyciana CRESS-DNA-virus sp. TaxID=2815024 RepID=A0A8A4XBL0_9VIRU|nr:MAG: capsid protein [Ciconia boyciana CRESS-DNA-virus sp.]